MLLSLFTLVILGSTAFIVPAYADDDHEGSSAGGSHFQCPEGIATCYSADGTMVSNSANDPVLDINSLPASAAGVDEDGHVVDEHGDILHDEDGHSIDHVSYVNTTLPKVVAPQHFTSM